MIDIIDLCKNYGPVAAVRNLNLKVPRGELFCFLGPNGAGKTTTIKILTGLLRPNGGRTLLNGIDVMVNPVEAKRLIGYIPDMPFLYERLTVSEFCEFTGDLFELPKDLTRQRMQENFDLFGLQEQRASLIKSLSHGMRQRLLYASCFIHNPSILFIDEPLIGLDPYTIRLIKDLLIRKARSGMTVFLTTHILALAQDIADRIGIILNGELIALGTLDELKRAHGGNTLEDLFLDLTSREKKEG